MLAFSLAFALGRQRSPALCRPADSAIDLSRQTATAWFRRAFRGRRGARQRAVGPLSAILTHDVAKPGATRELARRESAALGDRKVRAIPSLGGGASVFVKHPVAPASLTLSSRARVGNGRALPDWIAIILQTKLFGAAIPFRIALAWIETAAATAAGVARRGGRRSTAPAAARPWR